MIMPTRILRLLLSTLAAVMAAMFGSTANAAFYGSDFDPVNFAGKALFSLNANCETNGIHVQDQLNLFDGCVFSLTSFPFVKLVDSTNPAHTTTLNFGSNPGKLPDFNDMLGLVYLDGDLAGVTTGFIGGFAANDPTGVFSGLWYLQFVAIPIFTSSSSIDSYSAYSHPTLTLTDVDNSVLLYHDCPIIRGHPLCSNGQLADTATTVTFAAVPEPGSMALIIGGIGAGWLARRRKQAA